MPANHWSAHSALDIVGALTEVRVGGAGPDRNPYAPRAPPASGSSPSDPAQDENRSRPKRKWRFGRIVPPRAPPHRGQNRAIMRMSSSASEMPARTILPERHFCGHRRLRGVLAEDGGAGTEIDAVGTISCEGRVPGGRLAGGPLPGGSGSSRSTRRCCTLERGAPAGRFGVFRMIPGFLLECWFSVDGLPCAEGPALHMGGFQQR